MPNQENSPKEPASSGYVSADFDEFLTQATACTIDVPPLQITFYTAYLMCYNRLMAALRADNDPKVAVEITAAVREELIKYLSTVSGRDTMN